MARYWSGVGRSGQLLTSRSREPMRSKQGEYARSRVTEDPREKKKKPTRGVFPRAKVRERPRREPNPAWSIPYPFIFSEKLTPSLPRCVDETLSPTNLPTYVPNITISIPRWGSGGFAVSLLASHQGEPGSIPGRVTPMWGSCRTMPLVGGFSRGYPVSPALSFRRCSLLTSITLIAYCDLAVKSHPNLFKQSAVFVTDLNIVCTILIRIHELQQNGGHSTKPPYRGVAIPEDPEADAADEDELDVPPAPLEEALLEDDAEELPVDPTPPTRPGYP
ncbi:hypothetical protein PR048_024520 [Dryococelus australis]|uniref:Uncharacterized protein n=1 Tax=Dryococelus australis TaxID=614101 RepID=A0ABQ9GNT8_9NEOP|nr:hypothetical protein PR048_024520 [Dryococelus australis]